MPSPMMQQFYEIKKEYPNDIIFFRLGDFYEMFDEDARVVAPILGLVLTSRHNKADGSIPMCGVPYHSSQNYINKLIQAGYSVALCEQQGNPKDTKGLVARKVVKVITPGTALLDNDSVESRYIASMYRDKTGIYIAFANIATGQFLTGVYTVIEAKNLLLTYAIKEIIIADNQQYEDILTSISARIISESRWEFQLSRAQEVLHSHFGVQSMQAFGFEVADSRLIPAGVLLSYLLYTQQEDLTHIHRLSIANMSEYMYVDIQTIRNLELFQIQSASTKGKSLYQTISRTCNPMGARLLQQWILKPLLNIEQIHIRQNHIIQYIDNSDMRHSTRELLSQVADIERIIARLSNNLGGPRDLVLLRQSLEYSQILFAQYSTEYTQEASQALVQCTLLIQELTISLQDQVPILSREGGFVARGYRQDIDELLDLSQGGKDWLLELQAKEQSRTGISSLKIKYNAVFGYYIEISNTHKSIQLPAEYTKKQTLANAERYITPELKDFEEKILASEAELLAKEQEIYEYLRSQVLEHIQPLSTVAQSLAYIDCIQGFATLAIEYHYVKPAIYQTKEIRIIDGRHPVLEQLIQEYIPNTCELYEPDHSLMLITGPNMGGKSTYIRQVALIVLLAQMGSFVPAKEAHIGIVDRIFTRVGASDNMGEGQSTFMVEMLEVASILNNATSSSLIILDEVGRGTSTYDGMSIANAIIHYIHNTIQARTLFATHYHELLSLETSLAGVVNYQVKIQESSDTVVFLHRIHPGGANKSYGLAIAKLAGFPQIVLDIASQTLREYEHKKSQLSFLNTPISKPIQSQDNTIDIQWKSKYTQLKAKIDSIDINSITPLQALETLQGLQEK